MKRPTIKFKKGKAGAQKGAWRFIVVAANGEPLATSEGYTSRAAAKEGAVALGHAVVNHFRDTIF